MNFRITDDGDARDIHEIYELLKAYNLSRREASQNVPIGVFLEDEADRKLAGLTGETFGNWLCIQFLFVSEQLRGRGQKTWLQIAFVDTFSFQAPAFYKKHDYREVFTLEEYPYTGQRHYYTKKLL